MILTKSNLWQSKSILTAIITLVHLAALIVSSTLIYLAWDGGAIIRQMNSPTLNAEVYRAIYDHYFPGVADPGWAPLSIFIGISNVLQLHVVAPLCLDSHYRRIRYWIAKPEKMVVDRRKRAGDRSVTLVYANLEVGSGDSRLKNYVMSGRLTQRPR